MDGSRGNSSSNDSTEKKEKQRLKRSLSKTDLQYQTNRFQRDILHQLKKPRIENNSESIDQAKDQPPQEIEKVLEQHAQDIMRRHFRDITKILADFEQQGVRLTYPGESSSAVDTPLLSQKHDEESTSDVIPDESVKALHATHTSTFKRVFSLAFEPARQANQVEGETLLQASAYAHQFAYEHTSLQAQKLILQQEFQKLEQKCQKLDQSILNIQQKCLRESMFKEIDKNTQKYVKDISKAYKEKYGSNYNQQNFSNMFSDKHMYNKLLDLKTTINIIVLRHKIKGLKQVNPKDIAYKVKASAIENILRDSQDKEPSVRPAKEI